MMDTASQHGTVSSSCGQEAFTSGVDVDLSVLSSQKYAWLVMDVRLNYLLSQEPFSYSTVLCLEPLDAPGFAMKFMRMRAGREFLVVWHTGW